MPAFDPGLGSEVREEFAEPNWAQWVKLNLEMIKSDGSLLKMEMLRSEDWVLENIDYQVPDEKPASVSETLTPVSTFLMSLPVESIRVPLRPLFAELQEVRQLLHELGVDSVIVALDLDLPEIGVRGQATVTGVEGIPGGHPWEYQGDTHCSNHRRTVVVRCWPAKTCRSAAGETTGTKQRRNQGTPSVPIT